jgi:hypothetical protein
MRLVSGRLLREFRLTRRKGEPSRIGRVLMIALCASRRISPPILESFSFRSRTRPRTLELALVLGSPAYCLSV